MNWLVGSATVWWTVAAICWPPLLVAVTVNLCCSDWEVPIGAPPGTVRAHDLFPDPFGPSLQLYMAVTTRPRVYEARRCRRSSARERRPSRHCQRVGGRRSCAMLEFPRNPRRAGRESRR